MPKAGASEHAFPSVVADKHRGRIRRQKTARSIHQLRLVLLRRCGQASLDPDGNVTGASLPSGFSVQDLQMIRHSVSRARLSLHVAHSRTGQVVRGVKLKEERIESAGQFGHVPKSSCFLVQIVCVTTLLSLPAVALLSHLQKTHEATRVTAASST